MLDIRSSEDRGSEHMVLLGSYNTRQPANINDEDMDPESQDITERIGFTEMTFSLISHHVSVVVRQFRYSPLEIGNEDQNRSLSFEERSRIITDCNEHIENNFLIYCDISNPIAFIATIVARLIMSRMWLGLFHPFPQDFRLPFQRSTTRARILQTAVEVLEYAHLLEREPALAQWRWLFGTWVQWHALAITLASLCVQNQGPLVERAWRIVDLVYEDWAVRIADSARGMLWRPIKKLMGKAQANRRNGILISGGMPMMDSKNSYPNVDPQPLLLQMPPISSLQIPDILPDPLTNISAVGDLLPDGTLQLGLPPYTFDPNQHYLPDMTPPSSNTNLGVGAVADGDANMLDPIDWMEWDEFMREFEMEQSGKGTEGAVDGGLMYPPW